MYIYIHVFISVCFYFLYLFCYIDSHEFTPIFPILSQYLILIFSLYIIVTCFWRSEKPGSLSLNIFTYLTNPLYVTVSPNGHHTLSPANALLTLIGLWHPALGYPSTEALLLLLGLLHSELSQSPAETLFSSGALPSHIGYRGSSHTHLRGHLLCRAPT